MKKVIITTTKAKKVKSPNILPYKEPYPPLKRFETKISPFVKNVMFYIFLIQACLSK